MLCCTHARRALPIDSRRRVRQQAAAEFGRLIAQDDAGTALRGGQCRRNSGTAAADDQYVAMRITLRVAVRIGLGGRPSQARRAPNHRLVQRLPGLFGPHEGLVVKACGEEARQAIVDAAEIAPQARPTILALGNQAIVQLDLRGAQIGGDARRIAAHGHQGVRLLGTGGENTPRPVILERASGQMHAIGEQGRGERVAREPFIRSAIEGKAQTLMAVDAPAGGRAPLAARSWRNSGRRFAGLVEG